MTISCRNLERACPADQLRDIAKLIYDTDPYIYPAMFSSREEAEQIIPRMMAENDVMFRPENIFAAVKNGRVLGIILYVRGPMRWKPDVFLRCGGSSPYTEKLYRNYFSMYESIPSDVISLINVCVAQDARGAGIGGILLKSFLNGQSGPMELYVLADNQPAIRLYAAHGFRIRETLRAFTVDDADITCYRMMRD